MDDIESFLVDDCRNLMSETIREIKDKITNLFKEKVIGLDWNKSFLYKVEVGESALSLLVSTNFKAPVSGRTGEEIRNSCTSYLNIRILKIAMSLPAFLDGLNRIEDLKVYEKNKLVFALFGELHDVSTKNSDAKVVVDKLVEIVIFLGLKLHNLESFRKKYPKEESRDRHHPRSRRNYKTESRSSRVIQPPPPPTTHYHSTPTNRIHDIRKPSITKGPILPPPPPQPVQRNDGQRVDAFAMFDEANKKSGYKLISAASLGSKKKKNRNRGRRHGTGGGGTTSVLSNRPEHLEILIGILGNGEWMGLSKLGNELKNHHRIQPSKLAKTVRNFRNNLGEAIFETKRSPDGIGVYVRYKTGGQVYHHQQQQQYPQYQPQPQPHVPQITVGQKRGRNEYLDYYSRTPTTSTTTPSSTSSTPTSAYYPGTTYGQQPQQTSSLVSNQYSHLIKYNPAQTTTTPTTVAYPYPYVYGVPPSASQYYATNQQPQPQPQAPIISNLPVSKKRKLDDKKE